MIPDGYTQRWRDGNHTWRHKSEGGFDSSQFEVAEIDELTAKRFVVGHHYSASYPASSLRYGLFWGEQLAGVMVLGIPVQKKVLTNVFPALEAYSESLELSRFVLLDEVPANGESWFLKHGFRAAAHEGIRGIVSFSDPIPRRIGGRELFPGHLGIIYQASNAIYTGTATARTLTLLPDGSVFNHRSEQKVRSQERGHGHVEAKLVSLGAPAMRAGQDPAEWLREALDVIPTTRLRHTGNLRYAFRLGRNRTERNRVAIDPPPLPYPKERAA